MKLGFVSPNTPQHLGPAALAVELESRGYESLWVGEHPKIPVAHRDRFPGGMPAWLPWMWDPLLSLLAAAGATSDLVLGTAVALPLERDLFTFAKQVSTLDRMSGGRLVLGLGVGFRPAFEISCPFPWRDRYRALGEMVAALDVLWNEDEPEFHGEFIDFDPVLAGPRPLQRRRPPLLAATTGPAATGECLRWADGWIPGDAALADVAAAVDDVRRRTEHAGRDPESLDLTVMAWGDPSPEWIRSLHGAGFGRVIVGGGRRDAHDPSTTLAFLDRYSTVLDDRR